MCLNFASNRTSINSQREEKGKKGEKNPLIHTDHVLQIDLVLVGTSCLWNQEPKRTIYQQKFLMNYDLENKASKSTYPFKTMKKNKSKGRLKVGSPELGLKQLLLQLQKGWISQHENKGFEQLAVQVEIQCLFLPLYSPMLSLLESIRIVNLLAVFMKSLQWQQKLLIMSSNEHDTLLL